MTQESLILRGVKGLIRDFAVFISPGFDGTIGRSRRCNICLKNAPGYINSKSNQTKDEEHFKTASRQHLVLRITKDNKIILRDNSTNGTFLNAEKIVEKELTPQDLQTTPHTLRLGTTETFQLEWGPKPEDINDKDSL
ncbi:FHA domain-containing protein [Planctomycetota bacterium]